MSDDHKIVVRFGEEILEKGFTAIPNLVLNYYRKIGIEFGEMMIIIHIWQFWWGRDNPYPSIEALARAMDVNKRTVKRYVASLATKMFTTDENNSFPLLIVYDRFNKDNSQTSNEYDFSNLLKAVLYLYKKDKPKEEEQIKYVRKARYFRGDNSVTGECVNLVTLEDDNSVTGEDDKIATESGAYIPPREGQPYPPNNTNVNTFENTNVINTDRMKDREIEISASSFNSGNNNDSIKIDSPNELINKWSKKWNVSEQVVRINLIAAYEQIDKGNMIDDLEAYIKRSVTKYLQQEALKDFCRPKKEK